MPISRRRFRRRVSVLLSAMMAAHAALCQASFQGIGMLPGGTNGSSISAVSSNGQVVVGVSSCATGNQAFRWQSGTLSALGTLPGGSFSESYDLTANGSIIVGASSSTLGLEAFWWDGTMSGLGDLPSGPTQSSCTSTNFDGTVLAGQGSTALGYEAFRYYGGVMTGLGYLTSTGTRTSFAHDISADGTVIVGGSTSALSGPNKTEAFCWRNGTMFGLGDLTGGSFESVAFGVSPDGGTIIGYSSGTEGIEAFVSRNGVMVGLGDLPGGNFESAAFRASENGERIIGWSSVSTEYGAFLWDKINGMRAMRDILVNDFNLGSALQGWKLTYATGISDDGTVIVGWGINPQGTPEGWIVNIPGAVSLTGKIVLSNVTNEITGRVATIELARPGDSISRQTEEVVLDANGNYSLTTFAYGNFDVYAKSDHHLRKKLGSVMFTHAGATNVNFMLVNGDCDNDNEVTLVDFGLLSSVFGKDQSESGFIASCDLDNDGEVNILDFAILANSFGQAGD